MVFHIQRASIDDGPGIRTVVFLKGCPMRCAWCHNPESQHAYSEILLYPSKCLGCGKCVAACLRSAQAATPLGRVFHREKCIRCGACAGACLPGALAVCGKELSVSEVLETIKKDEAYYRNSGGGVTFSGGEPLLQADFLLELLQECKKHGFHCAIETAGNVEWKRFEMILPLVDLFLYDVKSLRNDVHKKITGVGNEQILSNLKRLSLERVDIKVRMPIIPTMNDNEEEMKGLADLLLALGDSVIVQLLPYHGIAENKYETLGIQYFLTGLHEPDEEAMCKFRCLLKANLGNDRVAN